MNTHETAIWSLDGSWRQLHQSLSLLARTTIRDVFVQEIVQVFLAVDARFLNLLQLLVHEVAQGPVCSTMILENLLVADEARPVVVVFNLFDIRNGKVRANAFVAEDEGACRAAENFAALSTPATVVLRSILSLSKLSGILFRRGKLLKVRETSLKLT